MDRAARGADEARQRCRRRESRSSMRSEPQWLQNFIAAAPDRHPRRGRARSWVHTVGPDPASRHARTSRHEPLAVCPKPSKATSAPRSPARRRSQRRLRDETAKLPRPACRSAPTRARSSRCSSALIGARRAIEIGTFTGYSALAVAAALPADGRLVCCDVSDEWTAIARRYWAEAGVAGRIDLRLAPAHDTLRELLRDARCRQLRLRVHRRRQDRLRRATTRRASSCCAPAG